MRLKLQVCVDPEHEEYLQSSARLRRITVNKLVRKIVAAVLDGHLILATLDDEDEVVKPSTRASRARKPQHVV